MKGSRWSTGLSWAMVSMTPASRVSLESLLASTRVSATRFLRLLDAPSVWAGEPQAQCEVVTGAAVASGGVAQASFLASQRNADHRDDQYEQDPVGKQISTMTFSQPGRSSSAGRSRACVCSLAG